MTHSRRLQNMSFMMPPSVSTPVSQSETETNKKAEKLLALFSSVFDSPDILPNVLWNLNFEERLKFARVNKTAQDLVFPPSIFPHDGRKAFARQGFKVEDFVGSVEALEWAKTMGCPWNSITCLYAAGSGHLDVLIWARENGCEWDAWTCAAAAEGGHLHVLIWARENGCEWDRRTIDAAIEMGHMDVATWALENGCSRTALVNVNV